MLLPLRFGIADKIPGRDRSLPPARLRFRVSETIDEDIYRTVSLSGAQRIVSILAEAGMELNTFSSVLDFGCGCGRTLRALPSINAVMWGADIDEASIEWCQANLRPIQFAVAPSLPPLKMADASFDLIYAISVFTHLDFSFQSAWRDELFRLLKPGGVLLFTIHGEGVSSNRLKAKNSENGFRFEKSQKLAGVLPGWYHTAYQTPASVLNNFGRRFHKLRRFPRGMGDQDAYLAWKQ